MTAPPVCFNTVWVGGLMALGRDGALMYAAANGCFNRTTNTFLFAIPGKNQIRPCYVFVQWFFLLLLLFLIVCPVKEVSLVIFPPLMFCLGFVEVGYGYLRFHSQPLAFLYSEHLSAVSSFSFVSRRHLRVKSRILLWVQMFPCHPVWSPLKIDGRIFIAWIFSNLLRLLLYGNTIGAFHLLHFTVIYFICNLSAVVRVCWVYFPVPPHSSC